MLEVSRELASVVLSKGPVAVRLARLAIKAGLETDQRTGLLLERVAQAVLFMTEDKEEGTNAFMEKRKPHFHGK